MTDGTTTWTYTYNADGLRTSKTNGSLNYTYFYDSGRLYYMTRGTDQLWFAYDDSVPMFVKYNATTYLYLTNLQGDVIAILDNTGAKVVEYAYDAWGNLLSITGSMASTLGVINPLTYRGYVYDHETGLYYLQSRYYNPTWGRFLNADSFVSTGGSLGSNMFAYCENDPVNLIDSTGTMPLATAYRDDPMMSNYYLLGGGGGGVSGAATMSTATAGVIGTAVTVALVNQLTKSTQERQEVLVDALVLAGSQDTAIYYGINLHGGTMNTITGPMTFIEADAWVTMQATSCVYSNRASWGLYTDNIDDAAAMAFYLGAPDALTPAGLNLPSNLVADIAKGSKYYSHFHTFERKIHGISAPSFHVWFGMIGG